MLVKGAPGLKNELDINLMLTQLARLDRVLVNDVISRRIMSPTQAKQWGYLQLQTPQNVGSSRPGQHRDQTQHSARTSYLEYHKKYCKVFNIRHTKSQNLNDSYLVLQLSWPNPLKPVLSGEWRCIWSSAWCRLTILQNIWVINNFIAY